MKLMDEDKQRALYTSVRNADPEIYQRVIEIGHLGDPSFTGHDPVKRCAIIEEAVMHLAARLLRLA